MKVIIKNEIRNIKKRMKINLTIARKLVTENQKCQNPKNLSFLAL